MTTRNILSAKIGNGLVGAPAGGYDVSTFLDRQNFEPPSGDLGGLIETVTVPLKDTNGTIPIVPREGLEILLYDQAAALAWGGFISQPIAQPPSGVRAWALPCQSWAARFSEASTGSLNKAGIIDNDRNFLIAMIRDGLKAQTFGADTVGIDDAIITANEPDWIYVQGTAILTGADWSYKPLIDVVRDLLSKVPGVYLRIRPDKQVEYGLPGTVAPYTISSLPSYSLIRAGVRAEIVKDSYQEQVITAGHFNHVRLGGAGAAEEIATDEVSFGKYGRPRKAPYENDETIVAGDLRRAAYAKLARLGERKIVNAGITDDGVEPGMLVPVIADELGCIDDFGWFPDVGWSFYFGTPFLEPAVGWRGEFLVQKVKPTFIAPGVYGYELELGAYQPDFDRALATQIGGTT